MRPGRKQHVQIKRFLEAHRRLLRGLHVRFSSMIELAARSRITIHGRESRALKRRAQAKEGSIRRVDVSEFLEMLD
jgi:hypothetical protein